MANEKTAIKRGRELRNEVTVIVGGRSFDGWQSVSISKNLESICNSFNIKLWDKFEALRELWPLKPGEIIKVNINRERVFTGRIEKLDVNYTDEDRSYSISGRSLPGDLVDCMHEGPAEYKNIPLDKLAETLVAPFGLKVFLSVDPKTISKFSVKPGETIFEALDRAARTQGFFFVSTRAGNIRLTRAARARSFTDLEQDVNILSGTANYDDSQRFSKYVVKGQTSGLPNFNGAQVTEPEGTATDNGVKRNRPYIMIGEGNTDASQAQTRAQWEASSRLAKAIRINVDVQGWTQEDGSLWGINQLTRVKSRFLGVNKDLLITSVEHKNGTDEGLTTTLTLVDPQSYQTEPVLNKKESDDIFSQLGASS